MVAGHHVDAGCAGQAAQARHALEHRLGIAPGEIGPAARANEQRIPAEERLLAAVWTIQEARGLWLVSRRVQHFNESTPKRHAVAIINRNNGGPGRGSLRQFGVRRSGGVHVHHFRAAACRFRGAANVIPVPMREECMCNVVPVARDHIKNLLQLKRRIDNERLACRRVANNVVEIFVRSSVNHAEIELEAGRLVRHIFVHAPQATCCNMMFVALPPGRGRFKDGLWLAAAMSPDSPQPIPMAGPGQAQDPRAQERLQRRLRIIQNMKQIKHKLIVASGKGGVGKSTVAVNLAASLAAAGHTVGILDMDLTGPNVPKMLGIEGGGVNEQDGGLVPVKVNDKLSVMSMQFLLQDPDQAVVWRGPIKMQIIGQFLGDVVWGAMDYLIIDLPPGTSDEPLSVAQNIPDADGVILVTTPQEVALGDVRKSAQFVKKLELPLLGVVENMSGMAVEGHTSPNVPVTLAYGGHAVQTTSDGEGNFHLVMDIFKRGGGQAMAEKLGVPFLGAVPLDPRVMDGGDSGKPFSLEQTGNATQDAFKAIVAHLPTV